jgi:hypothetical protein
MPSRISRYYGLEDEVGLDPREPGRTVLVKAPRLPVDPGGTFEHTLAAGDRLDRLASIYYDEPRRWWLICDANPDVLSPLELVGRGPLRTLRVPLTPPAEDAPRKWAQLGEALREHPGVLRLRLTDEPAAVLTYNRFVVEDGELLGTIAAHDFAPGEPRPVDRVGKPITVPPNNAR